MGARPASSSGRTHRVGRIESDASSRTHPVGPGPSGLPPGFVHGHLSSRRSRPPGAYAYTNRAGGRAASCTRRARAGRRTPSAASRRAPGPGPRTTSADGRSGRAGSAGPGRPGARRGRGVLASHPSSLSRRARDGSPSPRTAHRPRARLTVPAHGSQQVRGLAHHRDRPAGQVRHRPSDVSWASSRRTTSLVSASPAAVAVSRATRWSTIQSRSSAAGAASPRPAR